MTTHTKRFVWFVLAVALGIAGAPAIAAATDPPAPAAMFYELTENMKLRGGKIVHRLAVSALGGFSVVGTPFCPTALVLATNPGAPNCELTAVGQDNVDATTGLGVFDAKIAIVVQGDNPFDGPEYVVDKIKVKGKMDFTAALAGLFFGTVKGFADIDTTPGKDRFTGVFRMPFIGSVQVPNQARTFRQALCPLSPNKNPYFPLESDFAYVETANGQLTGKCIDVRPDELSLGWPMVRFDLWFQ